MAAQDACAAGADACAAAYRRKMRHYAHLFPQLRRAGVVFQPMVWSAEGRPHPAAARVMEHVVRKVGARRGAAEAADFRARWRHEVAVAIQRRRAAMMRSVLPAGQGRQAWLAGSGGSREGGLLPPLEAEAEEVERDGVDEEECQQRREPTDR